MHEALMASSSSPWASSGTQMRSLWAFCAPAISSTVKSGVAARAAACRRVSAATMAGVHRETAVGFATPAEPYSRASGPAATAATASRRLAARAAALATARVATSGGARLRRTAIVSRSASAFAAWRAFAVFFSSFMSPALAFANARRARPLCKPPVDAESRRRLFRRCCSFVAPIVEAVHLLIFSYGTNARSAEPRGRRLRAHCTAAAHNPQARTALGGQTDVPLGRLASPSRALCAPTAGGRGRRDGTVRSRCSLAAAQRREAQVVQRRDSEARRR